MRASRERGVRQTGAERRPAGGKALQTISIDSVRNARVSSQRPIHCSPEIERWAGEVNNRPIKVLLYSHDTFGLGHLRRNLAITNRLLATPGQFSVHLLTGSPVIDRWSLPPELRVQPLPPVVKVGAERYEFRDRKHCFGLVKGYREALILKLVMRHRPDVFLVDHAPAGMNGELLGTLALIRREMPHTRVMLGLRDILDSPEIVQTVWREQDIPALLDQAYDDILVYGSRAHFDVVEGYGMTGRSAANVRYCGHVVAAPDSRPTSPSSIPALSPRCWNASRAAGREVVLVTAGGGGDGHFLMRAYLEALARTPSGDRYSVIVTGPLMAPEDSAGLRQLAAGREDVEFVDYTTDLVPSLRAADLIVAMAGYNTSAEIIAERKKAILVPRAAPRAEQRLRATRLARLGVVRTVEADQNLAHALGQMVPAALAAPPPPASAWNSLDLNGANRVADHLLSLGCLATADRHGHRLERFA